MSSVLRVAPEWECWPLWDHETGDNLDPASLGLPPDLVRCVAAWDDRFQATFNRDDPPASDFPSAEARAVWRAEGDALIAALRARGFAVIDRR